MTDEETRDPLASNRCTEAASDLTDESLIDRIADGDREALRWLHDRYRDRVYMIALRVCEQESDAESVVVTVFLTIWNNPRVWNPDRGSIRTYLHLLARSRATDLCRSEASRRRGARSAMPEMETRYALRQQALDPETQRKQGQRSARVRELVDQLPGELREVLVSAFFGGLTHVEIASQMNLPLGTVKTRIRRGLSRMREVLSSLENDW